MSKKRTRSKQSIDPIEQLRRLAEQMVQWTAGGELDYDSIGAQADCALWTLCTEGGLGNDEQLSAVVQLQRWEHEMHAPEGMPIHHGFAGILIQRWCPTRIPGCPISPINSCPPDDFPRLAGRMLAAVADRAAAIRSGGNVAVQPSGTPEKKPDAQRITDIQTEEPYRLKLDGAFIELKTAEQAWLIRYLHDAGGGWVTGLDKRAFPISRPDRVRKWLPEQLRKLIVSGGNAGFRLITH